MSIIFNNLLYLHSALHLAGFFYLAVDEHQLLLINVSYG